MKNHMKLEFLAVSENEPFARNTIAAFCLALNPTLDELSDIKTAVSEAVTNCIVHAYKDECGIITVECETHQNSIHIKISDNGKGIEDLNLALQPFYTTLSDEERSGMGFTIMQTFMNDFSVKSEKGLGTTVFMSKHFGSNDKAVNLADVD